MPVLGLVIAVLVVLLDYVTKLWASTYLVTQPGGMLELWQGVFRLTYVENRGAAFGMLQGKTVFFLILTVLVSLVILWFLFFNPRGKNPLWCLSLAFLLGGTIGNGIDRFLQGYVVDLFDFYLIHFAVFNVADSFLSIGIVLLILCILFGDRKKTGKTPLPAAVAGEDGMNER